MSVDQLVEQWRAMGPAQWAEHAMGWIGTDGKPITLYPWQRAYLEAYNAHRERVTTAAISNIKKTGKTFVDAVHTGWRWLALPGLHYCCANDLDQASGRQFQMIGDMVRAHPYLSTVCRLTQEKIVFEPTGSQLVALAVDAAGNAGSNHLTSSHTEAWGILYEAGIRAWEELTTPPGRHYGLPALRIADSYAGWAGESDTWHNLVDRGLAGERIDPFWPIFLAGGLLLFHASGEWARLNCFAGTPEEAEAYYDDQRRSLRAGAFARMHDNHRTSGEEAFVPIDWWDRACVAPPVVADTALEVTVGVDAGLKRDSSGVAVCAFDRATGKVRLVAHRVFLPRRGETLDLESTLEDAVRDVCQRFKVKQVLFDPWQFQRSAQELRKRGIPMTEFPQTVPNLTAMSMNVYELLKGENLAAYPDDDLRRAVLHAVVEESARGMKLTKTKSSHRIDILVALAMAALGAVRVLSQAPAVAQFNRENPFWDGLPGDGAENMFDRAARVHNFDSARHRRWAADHYCEQCHEEYKRRGMSE